MLVVFSSYPVSSRSGNYAMSDTPSDPHAKAEGVPASVNGESKDLNGEVEKPVEPVITVEDGTCLIILLVPSVGR